MDARTLSRQLDFDVFRPVRLTLADGTAVDVSVPYLSFVNGAFLYVAHATSADAPAGGPKFLPLQDIVQVEHEPIPGNYCQTGA